MRDISILTCDMSSLFILTNASHTQCHHQICHDVMLYWASSTPLCVSQWHSPELYFVVGFLRLISLQGQVRKWSHKWLSLIAFNKHHIKISCFPLSKSLVSYQVCLKTFTYLINLLVTYFLPLDSIYPILRYKYMKAATPHLQANY